MKYIDPKMLSAIRIAEDVDSDSDEVVVLFDVEIKQEKVIEASCLMRNFESNKKYQEWLFNQLRMLKTDVGTAYNSITNAVTLGNKVVFLSKDFAHVEFLRHLQAYDATCIKCRIVPEQWSSYFESMFGETVYRG